MDAIVCWTLGYRPLKPLATLSEINLNDPKCFSSIRRVTSPQAVKECLMKFMTMSETFIKLV